ncbi:DNA mismatch repair protein MutS [Bienertia sinuspersici]
MKETKQENNSLTISSSSIRFKCPFSYQIELTIDLKS